MTDALVIRLYEENTGTREGPAVRLVRWTGANTGGITLTYWIRDGVDRESPPGDSPLWALPVTRVAFSPSMTDSEAIRKAIRVYDELARLWKGCKSWREHSSRVSFCRDSWDLISHSKGGAL